MEEEEEEISKSAMGTGRRVAVIFWHRERVLCVETDGWYTNLVCCGAMPNLPAALHLTTWLCWERKSSGLVLLKESNCSTATIWSQQTTKCVYAQWACLIFEPLDSALLCMCVPPEEKKTLATLPFVLLSGSTLVYWFLQKGNRPVALNNTRFQGIRKGGVYKFINSEKSLTCPCD